MMLFCIYLFGDVVFVCEVLLFVMFDCQCCVWVVVEVVCVWFDVIDVVFGMNNLIIVFDVFVVMVELFMFVLCDVWEMVDVEYVDGCEVEILVEYGGVVGFDLVVVVVYMGLLVDEVVVCYVVGVYVVFFVGFQFGFVYFGGFDVLLYMLCCVVLCFEVLVGLVGIGGVQMGIYLVMLFGGW